MASKFNSNTISSNYDVILLLYPKDYLLSKIIKKADFYEFKVDYKRTLFIRKNIKNNI